MRTLNKRARAAHEPESVSTMLVSMVPREKGLTASCVYVILLLIARQKILFAIHSLIGEAPVFQSQPDSIVVVSSDVFTTVNGVPANLALSCSVTGNPTPGITWFREDIEIPARFVMSDGTLVLNVTNNVEASREGMRYHCTATNVIALNPFFATARSRDSLAIYTYFDGFEGLTMRTTEIETVEGGAVAMRCDHKEGMPIPEITWYMNDGGGPIEVVPTGLDIVYLEYGRYLVINKLTPAERSSSFYCVVTNAFLGTNSQRSFITYSLSRDIPANQLTAYKQNTQIITTVGSTVVIAHPIAYRQGPEGERIELLCTVPNSILFTSELLVANISGLTDAGVVNIPCIIDSTFDNSELVIFSIVVAQRAVITSHTDNPVISRESFIGEGQIVFVCENIGLPTPTLVWFFNGYSVELEGVTMSENELVLPQPEFAYSGVYECVVSNTINNEVMDDRRSWVLEVRMPILIIQPLTSTNPSISEDRLVGLLITIPLGSPFPITVNVVSDPCPDIEWALNGININNIPEGNYSLTPNQCNSSRGVLPFANTLIIESPSLDTSGEYTIVFSHLGGSETASLYVTVPVQLSVLSLSVEMESTGEQQPACFLEGSNVILTCDISGFPRPVVRFIKNSQVITPQMGGFCRFTDASFDQIRISNIGIPEEGWYTCEAEATDGSDEIVTLTQAPFYLAICVPSVVIVAQEPLDPVSGKKVDLFCNVTGLSQPTVSWFKDSVLLTNLGNIGIVSSNGTSRLRIIAATQEDRGTYICVTTNEAGTVSKVFTLDTIGEFPVTVASQRPLIPVVGGEVELDCSVTGIPQPTINWLKDGNALSSTDNRFISRSDSGLARLRISEATQDDEGLYECIATNFVGSESRIFQVDIRGDIQIVTALQLPQVPGIGEQVVLSCNVTGTPLPTTTWFKDGEILTSSDKTYILNDDGLAKLIVNDAVEGDSGEYVCVSTNAAGSARNTFEVDVTRDGIGFVSVNASEQIIPGIAGEEAVLDCIVFGTPSLTIMWIKDGRTLSSNARIFISRNENGVARLRINRSTVDDSGEYMCVVTNGYITEARILTVDISGAIPEVNSVQRPALPVAGGEVELDCDVTSIPQSTVTWFKDSNKLSSTNNRFISQSDSGLARLRISEATQDDSGEYECVATNSVGSETRIFQLNIQASRGNNNDFWLPLLSLTLLLVSSNW